MVFLMIFCGLPGTGKTDGAERFLKRFTAEHLMTDKIRKRLFSNPTYSDEEKEKVYEEMFDQAKRLLKEGNNVIMDAVFHKKALRKKAKEIAEEIGCEFYISLFYSGEQETLNYLKSREDEFSDARVEEYFIVKKQFEEVDEEHFDINVTYFGGKLHLEQLEYAVGVINQKRIVDAFVNGALFDGKPILKETHISHVFIFNNVVFKMKKPVKFSFLDFSSLEKRKFFCERELELNKRLCGEVYLDVVNVTEHENRLKINGEGRVLDYLVRMKRLPEESLMSNLLEKGKVSKEDVEKMAEIMAGFHSKAEIKKEFNSPDQMKEIFDDLESIRSITESKLDFKEGFDRIMNKSSDFIINNRELFEKRVEKGMVKQCHGDFHSGNVFIVQDDIYIFDCIEFGDDFACTDTQADIAFMAMDLDVKGFSDLSKAFVDKYIEKSGDQDGLRLLNYYKCYRANVRAKIAGLRFKQLEDGDEKDKVGEECKKYLVLAERYALELNK